MSKKHRVGNVRVSCRGPALVLRNPQGFRCLFWQINRTVIVGSLETIVRPSHSHRIIFERPLDEARVSAVQFPYGIFGDCTATAPIPAGSPYSTRTAFTGLSPSVHTRNREIPVLNVNAYAEDRGHLRCLKNCTKKCRPIYRTAPGANVN